MVHFTSKMRSGRRDSLMSTLSEHTGNGNPTATSLQPKDTKEQIYGVLQQFDVLRSRFDRFLFRYIYIYLLGLFLLGELLIIPPILSQPQAGKLLLVLGVSVVPVVVGISMIWLFNVWRLRTPKTLRDLFEKSIDIPDGDANKLYLRSLENYRDTLGSPKKYILNVFPMIASGSLSVYVIVQFLSVAHLNMFATILFVVGGLLSILSFLGLMYCGGIEIWVMCISGRYVRKLVQAFQLSIQPLHTDKCGGLKLLGNFCFGLATPILISSGLLFGYCITIYFISVRSSVSNLGSRIDTVFLALYVGLPLLFLLYLLPVIVLIFILPLRDIHTKLVSQRETNEDTYNARIESLREKIQSLLDNDKVEEAKVLQEKKAILETLHAPYPTWPFSFRSQIFPTVLGAGGSLLVGMITGALPVILSLIFHTR
jgi:hypothetical protein